MMDPNKAVQYQNPAHAHDGTSSATFTVASAAADTTQLVETGLARVGSTTDLPLELTARGKGPIQALGGALVVGLCHRALGGLVPRPFTAVPGSELLVVAGGDYRAEFTSGHVCFGNAQRCLYTGASLVYNAALDRTEIGVDDPAFAASGYVVDASAQGLVAGFGNAIAGCSTALGQVCAAVGPMSLAVGRSSQALGAQSVAIGETATAYGAAAAALGQGYAPGDGSFACGGAKTGPIASSVASLVGTTVRIYGDARSRFAAYHRVLLFDRVGQRGQAYIVSEPAYSGGVTTFELSPAPTFLAERIVDTDLGYRATASGAGQATGSHAHAESVAIASADYAHAEGYVSTASGHSAHAEGSYTTASGQYAHAEGSYTVASARGSHAEGHYAAAHKSFQRALASGRFAEAGDAQYTEVVLRRATSDATPVELSLDGAAPSGTVENTSNRFLLTTGKTYACLVRIAARGSDGTSAFFLRQVVVKNVGEVVSLEGAPQTLGVDINPAGWPTPVITADDGNKSLAMTVTGAAGVNIRWAATVQAQEIRY